MCGERRGKSCLGKAIFTSQRTEVEINRTEWAEGEGR